MISSRRFLRWTTKSTKPCSCRNSLRWKPSGSSTLIVFQIVRGPAKPIRALGSAMMKSPSIAKLAVTPPVVGAAGSGMEGPPRFVEARERGGRLGHLHQAERALLHARAAAATHDDQRRLVLRRRLD